MQRPPSSSAERNKLCRVTFIWLLSFMRFVCPPSSTSTCILFFSWEKQSLTSPHSSKASAKLLVPHWLPWSLTALIIPSPPCFSQRGKQKQSLFLLTWVRPQVRVSDNLNPSPPAGLPGKYDSLSCTCAAVARTVWEVRQPQAQLAMSQSKYSKPLWLFLGADLGTVNSAG